MNLKAFSRLVSNVIPVATMLAGVAISLSSQAQTGRIYTSDDYSRAANLLNAWKRTWTSEIGLVLWQCFRPSISTNAKVGHGP